MLHADPWKSLKPISFVALGALGLRALWSFVKLAMPREAMYELRDVLPVVDGGLIFVAVVATMVLLGMGASAARKIHGPVGFHPALAALSFLVPFANVILPALAMRQVWKAKSPHRSEALVWAWWGLYVVHTIMNMARVALPIPYLGLLILLGLVGVWGAVVYFVGIAPAQAAGPAPGPWAPQGYPQPPHAAHYPHANMQPGYPAQPQPGYPAQPQPGYPAQPQPGYPAQPQPGYPAQPQPSYSTQPAGGFGAPGHAPPGAPPQGPTWGNGQT
ncbi:MAG: DUF4328 domain-containing protein [Myxococcales bacterium]|nr:DUF4328 domain-containing protein [Myxococcales bacterium]